jgi:hypothetical protein
MAYYNLKDNIPLTTKREVFCHHEETSMPVIGNGVYTIPFPINSCVDINAMENGLRDVIAISLLEQNTLGVLPRRITSNQTAGSRWQGIIVDETVLNALKERGQIYEALKREYQIDIQVKKASGPKPRELRENGFTRLIEISW